MARESSTKEPTTKHGDTRASSTIEGLDLFHPVLVDCNLDWSPAQGGNAKPERFYDSALRFIDDSVKAKATIASCTFSAGQRIKDKKIFEVRSIYVIGVEHKGGHRVLSKADRKKLLEEMATCSAWPLFRTLFSQLVSQTIIDLPLLPSVPKLRWVRPNEDNAKESGSAA